MEWQTPAVSEKFQSRFGRRPGTADSGDTGLGTSASESTEGDDFCMEHCLNLVCVSSLWGTGRHQAVLLDNGIINGQDFCNTQPHFQNFSPCCYHSVLLRIKSQWEGVGVCEIQRFIFHAHRHGCDGKNNRLTQQEAVTNKRLEIYFCFGSLGHIPSIT